MTFTFQDGADAAVGLRGRDLRGEPPPGTDVGMLLLLAQDEERRRIARELHDGTAPTLVALSLDLARLVDGLGEDGDLRELAASCGALCQQALRELRTVSFLLHPPQLERDGLASALEWFVDGFARRSGIHACLDASAAPEGRLEPELELALFRVAQEALTNVHRHSTGRRARVVLAAEADEVRLVVADDGAPLARATSAGVGLASMRERLEALGGRLDLALGDSGAVLTAVVPRARGGA